MPLNVTSQDCYGGRRARARIDTEFGIFIAPIEDDYRDGFAELSVVAQTTTGRPDVDGVTAHTYTQAETFLEGTVEDWARSRTYHPLRPEAVTVNIHPDLEDELDPLDIVYHAATTQHARDQPTRDTPF